MEDVHYENKGKLKYSGARPRPEIARPPASSMEKFYEYIGSCSAIEGDVLEVGLGWGFAADFAMSNQKCKRLDSFEKNPQAITEFNDRKQGKPVEPRHNIVSKDFLQDNGNRKYDFIYIDIMDSNSVEEVDAVIALCTKASGRLKPDGKITIEMWSSDGDEERLRNWLKDNFDAEKEHVFKDRRKKNPFITYLSPKQ